MEVSELGDAAFLGKPALSGATSNLHNPIAQYVIPEADESYWYWNRRYGDKYVLPWKLKFC
jgi:hypothetical protein